MGNPKRGNTVFNGEEKKTENQLDLPITLDTATNGTRKQ